MNKRITGFVLALFALLSATVATVLGTLAAIALVRFGRFRGRMLFSGMICAPLVMPEVITGLSLLLLFVASDIDRGFWTITFAHTTLTACFVTVVVQSRLLTFDTSLEEAAMDLGATPWTTFRTITLPLIAPAVGSGWLLAFTLSLDDLRALPQHEATLPIACVEGWSATKTWRGVRLADLLDRAED